MDEDQQSEERLEAASIKYNVARVVRLSSGRFALFTPFSLADGLALTAIGTLDEIGPLIPTAEQCSALAAPTRTQTAPSGGKATSLDLDELLKGF
jgi:hypothetical protein